LIRSAKISDDGAYRYRLDRVWDEGPLVVWAMLNPSTADGETDDPTLRRVLAFSHGWGFGGLVVVNLFAYRASKPTTLRYVDDPVGPGNVEAVSTAVGVSELVVCAWGAGVDLPALRDRKGTDIAAIAGGWGVPMACLGRTEKGRPVHPLYVAAGAKPIPYGPGRIGELQLPRDRARAE